MVFVASFLVFAANGLFPKGFRLYFVFFSHLFMFLL